MLSSILNINLACEARRCYLRCMIGFADVAVIFRLDKILEERGLSQSELARRSGVSFVTVNGIANNRTKQVSLATLDALCAALDVEPGELLEREGKRRRGR